MIRSLLAIAALAVAAAPASAYTPNPDDPYPPRPCFRCGVIKFNPAIKINPGLKYRVQFGRYGKYAR